MNLGHKSLRRLLFLLANGTRDAQHEVAVIKWQNPNDYEDDEMCISKNR